MFGTFQGISGQVGLGNLLSGLPQVSNPQRLAGRVVPVAAPASKQLSAEELQRHAVSLRDRGFTVVADAGLDLDLVPARGWPEVLRLGGNVER